MIFEGMGNDLPGNRIWERVGNNKGGDGKCPGIQQEYGSLGGVGSNLLFEDVNYPSHALCYGFLIGRKENSNICSFEFVIVYNYSIGNVLALTLEPTARIHPEASEGDGKGR